jgi:WD40 repeat protein
LGHTNNVEAVVFSPDGRVLASGGWDRVVRLWDAANGNLLRQIERSQDAIWWLAFSADGKTLAGGTLNAIYLWETATGKERGQLLSQRGQTPGLVFSRDGKLLLSGSSDGTALVWDLTGQKTDCRFQAVKL